jgi:hypothetical protein
LPYTSKFGVVALLPITTLTELFIPREIPFIALLDFLALAPTLIEVEIVELDIAVKIAVFSASTVTRIPTVISALRLSLETLLTDNTLTIVTVPLLVYCTLSFLITLAGARLIVPSLVDSTGRVENHVVTISYSSYIT